MIKIRLNSAKQTELVALHKRILKRPYKIQEKLNSASSNASANSAKQRFYQFLQKQSNLEKILFSPPDELYQLVDQIHPLYAEALAENATILKRELEQIFDYAKFRDNRSSYGAYTLVDFLQVNVCPYCNRISTVTHVSKRASSRPQLDHWLKQEEWPYLAISLFNLIPSCGLCNMNFKRRHSFSLNDHIHPYKEGYEIEYKFKYKSDLPNDKIESVDDFSLYIKPEVGIQEEIKRKGKNTIDILEIEGVYNKQKQIALDVIKKHVMFSDEYINEELDRKDKITGNRVFKNKTHYISIAFDIKTIGEYSLFEHAKLRKDIAEVAGLTIPQQEEQNIIPNIELNKPING